MAEISKLGRYEIRRILGQGAMGVVYEGFDPTLNRRVAIKTILKSHHLDPDTASEYSKRFVREAQAAARLNHPNIVQVHDFGEDKEVAYLVMEFIQGKELRSFFERQERFELDEVVRLMCELLGALDLAHEAGVIHRDVKPANVILDSEQRVKLADFGVARIQDSSDRSQAGTMVGTPAYMSPEQITGGKIDRRTDVFSCGVILYELLTGRRPFTGSGAWTVAKQIVQDDPVLPSKVDATVGFAFDAIIAKALSKSTDHRFKSAKEFAAELKRARGYGPRQSRQATVKEQVAAPPSSSTPWAPSAEHGEYRARQKTEVELEFWRSIKDSSNTRELELFVKKFPDGAYAELAQLKLEKLRGSAAAIAATKAERKPADAPAKTETANRTIAIPVPARRRGPAIAIVLLAVAGVVGAVYYERQAVMDRAANAEAARAAAETLARQEADKRTKAEALASEEAGRRTKMEVDARREAEIAARVHAEEEAKKAAEEKAKALALKAEEQDRRKAEIAAKKDAEAKAQAEARALAEARAQAEADARRRADEQARADAAKKLTAVAPSAPPPLSAKVLSVQSTWPASISFQGHLNILAERLERATDGQLKLKVSAAGQIVPAFEVLDATARKVLDGYHAMPAYWVGKNKAAVLFGGPPGGPFGMNDQDYQRWMWEGGGHELWIELYQQQMRVNLMPFLSHPMGVQRLGWFKRPFRDLADFKTMKCRHTGVYAEVYQRMGIATVNMPGGEIIPSASRGVIDCASWAGGVEDLRLGLHNVWKYYYAPGMQGNSTFGEFTLNLDVWNGFSRQQQGVVRSVVRSVYAEWAAKYHRQNAEAFEEFSRKHGVQFLVTPPDVQMATLRAWDDIAREEAARNPFFSKVLQSQRAFAANIVPNRKTASGGTPLLVQHYWSHR